SPAKYAFPEITQPICHPPRVWYDEGTDKRDKGPEFWKGRFEGLGRTIGDAGLRAEVFLWEDFHNRRVISNVVGIACGNGFDEQHNAEPDTWSRLPRDERDRIQREFDPAVGRGRWYSFSIGVVGVAP
ncbi:MAG TPA: hypothetical protein PLY00_17435, partial [Verrucomicrobiota bacterium]|nr:hypothetical protein [Verrucomicrobiota bacterium]HOG88762.1 hypothetical protein [Verrucomicrobiota bacterium]HOR73042.1 hypothetical protein [Verrucomicrobiota bacterium]HOU89293.1 hypothetical protein [Verrucomicrobiota bacterium]HPK99561.1 hypothetical protein [Verrucomicrobiota bacterium]